MATLTAWAFNTVEGAEQASQRLQSLQTQELIKIQDAAVVSWEEGKKKPKTRQLSNMTAAGALGGTFWGMLFGLIFFVPLLGAAIGAGIGALAGSMTDVGISDDFINSVKQRVTPGTSALLFLLSSDAVMDRVKDTFKDLNPELIASNLSADQGPSYARSSPRSELGRHYVLSMKEGSGGDAGASYESEASPFQQPARRPLLQRVVPVTEHVRGYRGGTLRRDLIAGVTVAALALPASLAYAEIAGLSPVIGLYALLLPALAYAVFGSSRQVIVGPDGSIAALVGSAVIPLAADPADRAPLAALLAILVGAVFLGAWLARLGWMADYFSRPVLIGYIHGVAAVLIVGQLGNLLGLSISGQTPPSEVIEVCAARPRSRASGARR